MITPQQLDARHAQKKAEADPIHPQFVETLSRLLEEHYNPETKEAVLTFQQIQDTLPRLRDAKRYTVSLSWFERNRRALFDAGWTWAYPTAEANSPRSVTLKARNLIREAAREIAERVRKGMVRYPLVPTPTPCPPVVWPCLDHRPPIDPDAYKVTCGGTSGDKLTCYQNGIVVDNQEAG